MSLFNQTKHGGHGSRGGGEDALVVSDAVLEEQPEGLPQVCKDLLETASEPRGLGREHPHRGQS